MFSLYSEGLKTYGKSIPKDIKVLDAAFNCGVFACVTPKAISLMDKYYDLLTKWLNNFYENYGCN